MAHTLQERLCAGLEARGHIEVVREAGSYCRFERTYSESGRVTSYYFVGVNGGLRIGRVKSESRSIGDPTRQTEVYKKLLAEGDSALAMQKLGVTNPDALDF